MNALIAFCIGAPLASLGAILFINGTLDFNNTLQFITLSAQHFKKPEADRVSELLLLGEEPAQN